MVENYFFQIKINRDKNELDRFFSKKTLFLLLTFLSLSSYAQQYNWQWAINGGGNKGGMTDYHPEEIYDIKVGSDNNYYFIASVEGRYNVELDGVSQTVWNNHLGNRDIFLFSTTCDGTVRWSRAIGGGGTDYSFNLVLDSNNNVYIAANVSPWLNWAGNQHYPVHFSNTDYVLTPYDLTGNDPSVPPDHNLPMEFYKNAYLVKYDSNGNYIKRKTIQSDELANVDFYASTTMYRRPNLYNLMIDSEDNLHFMGTFGKGNYFDNNVNVPSNYFYNAFTGKGLSQTRLIKCNSNLDYLDDMILPVKDSTGFSFSNKMHFAYDETLNRYYIAGERDWGSATTAPPIVYDNKAVVNLTYLLAINGMNSTNGIEGGEIWRREIYSAQSGSQLAHSGISSLQVDSNSDVYIGAKIWRGFNDNTVKIYDPNNPTTTTYPLSPTAYTYLPTVVKFNSNGQVQWAKHPSSFAPNYSTNTTILPKGLALNSNEVAFGSNEGYFVWDSFTQNYPQYHGTSPTILRFNKQTGAVTGMDYIVGPGGANNYMTAVTTDNDGNYVTGGILSGLFGDPNSAMGQLWSNGPSDFFVAKLGATQCGTSASTENFNDLEITVYPNPTTDIVNIDIEEKIIGYFIYNEAGQKLQAKTQTTHGVQQLNLEGFASGVYFVALKTETGKTATLKVVKK